MMKSARSSHDRHLDCQEALEDGLRDLIDQAVIAGWKPHEVFDALASLVRNSRLAYDKDPDPADDPVTVS